MSIATRRDAWLALRNTLGKRQRRVASLVRSHASGLTLLEMADRLGVPVNHVTGRVRELVERGVLRDSGRYRPNPRTRIRAIVWVFDLGPPHPRAPRTCRHCGGIDP